jgi:hypothetical protein
MICTKNKKKETNRSPLGKYISGEPMERVAVDIFWTTSTYKTRE